ncbi:hypothetical protein KSP40_PGU013163 [Platanthera guangdongensis]|uniref:Uncharacterized protein n=1 Tax=Platanthera guangdongensis TaxID=2320717 RepID=A0ABR2LRH5_9ASPA
MGVHPDVKCRPFLIPGLENQGICISLATGLSNGEIVASFRPKIELPGDAAPSQTPASSSQPIYSAGKLGSHVNIKMINGTSFQTIHAVSSYVSEVRMSKSAIICPERNNSLFAFGDESTHGVCLWNLPSFNVHSRHRPHLHPILDLKKILLTKFAANDFFLREDFFGSGLCFQIRVQNYGDAPT